MSDPIEVELKLEFDSADRDRLAAAMSFDVAQTGAAHLVTTYFDTPGRAVNRAGYSVRIRCDNGVRLQTVKAESAAAAGLFERAEWEREVASDVPVLDGRDGPLTRAVGRATLRRLAALFVTDVYRTSRTIERDGSRFIWSIDDGEIRAGPQVRRLCELEFELELGAPQTLFDFARRLNEVVPLRLAVQSKAQRGYALVGGDRHDAVKAGSIVLDRDRNVGDAFQQIARSCLYQFRRNEAVLDRGGAEALHQARVALRRLRSAFSCCEHLFAGDERAELFDIELHWLAAELGEVRNLDVLIARRLGREAQDRLVAARERAFAHALAEVGSARTRLLMIDLAEWLACGDWRVRPRDPDLFHRCAHSFATDLLETQRRQLKRRGKGLAGLDDRQRHKVRIAAKKLRYTSEFFASLYRSPKRCRRYDLFLAPLLALQDHLGDLNDLAIGSRILAGLKIDAKLPHGGKRGRTALLERADDAYRALIRAKRFWR